jgi:hypothetical protein
VRPVRGELFIPGPLPGLNELLAAAKSGHGRGNAYSRLKADWGQTVWAHAKAAKLRHFDGPASLLFVWREKNKRRDIDNVAGGGTKLVLDGLVKAGVLDGDGWRDVYSIEHRFQVDAKKPGVLVILGPAMPF